jgi:putative SOS response-associated peptidase YedK
MCGRYALFGERKFPANRLGNDQPALPFPELPDRYNIAPSQEVPALRQVEGAAPGVRQLALLRWGLIPSWAKDAKIAFQCINARSETVAERPAFRSAFKRRRCLLPASGFFEWQKQGKQKQPFLFQLKDGQPFVFAGLWECWSGPHGDCRETCTILTTEANNLVRPYHERMPVILPLEYHADWLNPDAAAPEWLQTVLRPYPADAMCAVPVSIWVNDARHEGPECVRRLE